MKILSDAGAKHLPSCLLPSVWVCWWGGLGLQTAAHHLESMRESRALGFGPGINARFSRTGDAPPSPPVQNRLLQEGVRELKRRADREATAVTELLEELRYEADGLL